MFTGTAVRAVAARVAASNVEKQQKQAADAELRRLAETTAAGRGAVGGGGGRGGCAQAAAVSHGLSTTSNCRGRVDAVIRLRVVVVNRFE